jgi:hypothetical protein
MRIYRYLGVGLGEESGGQKEKPYLFRKRDI